MSNTKNANKTTPKKTQPKIKEEPIVVDLDKETAVETIATQEELENLVSKDKVLQLIGAIRKQCYKSLTISRTQMLTMLDNLSKSITALHE